MTIAWTYFDLGADFIAVSLVYRGRRPAPEGAHLPSASDGARSSGGAGQIDSLGDGLELWPSWSS